MSPRPGPAYDAVSVAHDDDLAELFKQALDEETTGARGAGAQSARPRPPVTRSSVPARAETIGLETQRDDQFGRAQTTQRPTRRADEIRGGTPSLTPNTSGAAPPATRKPDTGRVDTGRVDTGRVDTGRVDTGRVDGSRGARSEVPRPARSTLDDEASGLVAIPRSEAHTLGRVRAVEPTAPRRDAAASPTPLVSSRPSQPSAPAEPSRRPAPTTGGVSIPPTLRGAQPSGPAPRASPEATLPPGTGRIRTSELPRHSDAPRASRSAASEIRGTPSAELTLPPELMAEQLDHKGRSKPMYAPRTPRPTVKRLRPELELLLGLLPGAYDLVRERLAHGLVTLTIAILALLPAAFVLTSWSARLRVGRELDVDPMIVALQAGAAIASLALFEALRAVSGASDERGELPLGRVLGVLFLPSLATLLLAPGVARAGAGVAEPFWLLAWVGLVFGVLGGAEALGPRVDRDRPHLFTAFSGGALGLALVAGLGVLAFSAELNRAAAVALEQWGFADVPRLVRGLHLPI